MGCRIDTAIYPSIYDVVSAISHIGAWKQEETLELQFIWSHELSCFMRVLDANEFLVREFELGQTIRCLNSRLHLANHRADQTLCGMVKQIVAGKLDSNDMFTFQNTACTWLARVAILRSPLKSGLGAIARNQDLALVLLEQMTPKVELADQFSVAFRLTPSEYKMCALLAQGMNVKEAAEILYVAEDTARQRLKAILSKTGTSRQVELVSLMRVFRT